MPHNCVRTFSVAYLSRSIAQIVRNATPKGGPRLYPLPAPRGEDPAQ